MPAQPGNRKRLSRLCARATILAMRASLVLGRIAG
jgi:hypothetical protein